MQYPRATVCLRAFAQLGRCGTLECLPKPAEKCAGAGCGVAVNGGAGQCASSAPNPACSALRTGPASKAIRGKVFHSPGLGVLHGVGFAPTKPEAQLQSPLPAGKLIPFRS